LPTDDPGCRCADLIRGRQVVAVKGIGGFHLVCDARNAAAVARLRSGKQREEKPFAVMVLNTFSARRYAQNSASRTARCWRRANAPSCCCANPRLCEIELPGNCAPGLSSIGLMLPYTPLQYLLFHELLGNRKGWTG
jgi:hydrogenase maturation protein HypF